MYSTLQVSQTVLQRLAKLKLKYGTKSYNELLFKLVQKEEGIPEDMFGAHPEMKPFSRHGKAALHEL
ncbi:hypothetical protein HZB89_00425 [archaeon]|nr:hypothetical protein [archaeon]